MSPTTPMRRSLTDRAAQWIRWLCVPIVLFWVAVAALTNALVPQLEVVGEAHNVALSSPDSPSLQAFQRIGKVFHEFDSDSAAMVVLEGDQPLGADAHQYYDDLIKRIEADRKHVQHVQDFWGDPLTAAGSQSPDGKAAYVQVFLAGNQGEALSLESVDALRDIIAETPAPPGIHAYVAGSAAQIADQFEVGNESTVMVTLLTVGVIAVMLLIVYRSPVTMILALVTVLDRDVGGPGNRRVPGERRIHRPVDVFDQHPHAAGHRRRHGLRDLPARPLSRATQRGHGPRGRLLRHVPRDVARDPRFGTDHRRRGLLPELHPPAVLPEPGHPGCDRRPRVAGRLADPGPRRDRDRRSLRSARRQSERRPSGAGGGSGRPSCVGPDRF